MTTTDLMIGNWVLDTRTNKPLRVNPFMSELEVPTWRPIPITQRILEINGFTKPHYGQTYKWESLDGFIIFVGLESNSITIYYGCRKFRSLLRILQTQGPGHRPGLPDATGGL